MEVCSARLGRPEDSVTYLVKMSSQALAAGLSSFGSSIGQGFQNYMAGREKRELLSGEAMAIYNELGRKGVRTQDEQKMFDKLEKAGDMGTRELQSIISEYETGEKMEQLQRTKRLQDLQIRNAERKEKSELDLMRFGKSIPEMESEFTGPEYGTVFDTSEVEANLAKDPSFYDAIDSEYLASNMVNKEVPMPPAPPLYADQADAVPIESVTEDRSAPAMNRFKAQALFNLGTTSKNKKALAKNRELNAKIEEAKRQVELSGGYRPDFASGQKLDSLIAEKKTLLANNPNLVNGNILPPQKVKTPETATLDVGEGRSFRNVPAYLLDQDARQAGDPRVKPYEPQAPQEQGPSMEMYSDIDKRTAMLDEGDTYEERRAKLVNALADYDLAPADRKQAIAMIDERYPKLREIASEAVAPTGERLGFTIGSTFIPAKSTGLSEAGKSGELELSSVTINDKGEVTRILKPRPKLDQGQKTFINSAREFKTQAQELLKVIETHGNYESSVTAMLSEGSADARAKLLSLPYRMAILYAKLVDPESVAREGEVEAARKYAIPLGATVPNAVTTSALNDMVKEIMRRESDFYETEGIDNPSNNTTNKESVSLADPAGIGI